MLHLTNSLKCFATYSTLSYVPKHSPASRTDIDVFKCFINTHQNILVVTGAGISTESGIPDYRSEEVGLYARSQNRPVKYQDFIKLPHIRKRYWARNFVGWPRFSKVEPNLTHLTLAKLENEHNKILGIVTQNVDNLHYKAGSENVVELHGSAYRIKCLSCKFQTSRHEFQTILEKLNPDMRETSNFIRPDGDVELSDVSVQIFCSFCIHFFPQIIIQHLKINYIYFFLQEQVQKFNMPFCNNCSGILKPDIVFFGDNVPKSRVQEVEELVKQCDAVLVLGSSLSVFSSYRIILQSHQLQKYIFIVNIGQTRADELASLKMSVKCSDVFGALS